MSAAIWWRQSRIRLGSAKKVELFVAYLREQFREGPPWDQPHGDAGEGATGNPRRTGR